jgi:hypothetical protein
LEKKTPFPEGLELEFALPTLEALHSYDLLEERPFFMISVKVTQAMFINYCDTYRQYFNIKKLPVRAVF